MNKNENENENENKNNRIDKSINIHNVNDRNNCKHRLIDNR